MIDAIRPGHIYDENRREKSIEKRLKNLALLERNKTHLLN